MNRSLLSAPAFNGGVTSALHAMPAACDGAGRVRSLGVLPGEPDPNAGHWTAILSALTPLAQATAAAALRSVGVPDALVQGGQAIAYSAQGYTFPGGAVTLRSGVRGTPMVSPSGQRFLLTLDGGAIQYADSDVAGASGGTTAPAPASTTNWPLILGIAVAGAALWFFVLRRRR